MIIFDDKITNDRLKVYYKDGNRKPKTIGEIRVIRESKKQYQYFPKSSSNICGELFDNLEKCKQSLLDE